MNIETALARFANGPVADPDAREMMRLSLLDWAACGIAGASEPLAHILRGKALDEGGAAQATLIGGGKVPARAAAQVNGATSHALDYDDTHFAHIGHTSVGVLPAALAMAELVGADMAELIDAALIGSEAAVRVGAWLGRDHYETGFHQTATAGAFGAALAAGRLAGLTEGQMLNALGLAATRAAGLKSQFGTMGKPYNAGIAAETGVEATLLARAGMVSNPAALSGPQGFGPTHHGAADAGALAGLGETWLYGGVSHKFHACCHGLHATIEALLTLNAYPDALSRIEIETHPRWLSVCNKPAPATGLEAKFSYAQVAAMVLRGVDTAAIANFSDDIANRADLRALRERVTVRVGADLSEMQARVSVTGADGATITASHDLDAPMTLAARAARLRRKAEGLLGAGDAATLWDTVGAGDITGFADILARAK